MSSDFFFRVKPGRTDVSAQLGYTVVCCHGRLPAELPTVQDAAAGLDSRGLSSLHLTAVTPEGNTSILLACPISGAVAPQCQNRHMMFRKQSCSFYWF